MSLETSRPTHKCRCLSNRAVRLRRIYSDRDGLTPLANPFQADADGLARFYAAGNAYRVTASLGGFERIWRHRAIGLLGEQDVVQDNQFYYRRTAAEITAGITIADYSYEPYNMRRYYSGADTADSSTAFSAAIEMCRANGIRALRAPGKWTITSPILIDNVLNQGIWIYIDELVAGTTGTWASTPADWKAATGMIKIGTASSGAPININLHIGSIRGNSRRADGIHIGNGSYGCGASYFWVGDVRDTNIFAKIDGAIWPTPSNCFEGNWVGSSNLGFWIKNTANHAEDTIIKYKFINHCDFGGILAYRGSQYLTVHEGLDFNGEYLTELKVAGFSTFDYGNTVTGGTSGTQGEIVAMYATSIQAVVVFREESITRKRALLFPTQLLQLSSHSSGLTSGSQWLFTAAQATDNALRAMDIVTVSRAGIVAYDWIASSNITMSVSGANLQALHGTGGTKTIRATILRVR
jgi:hypothetical protein